MFLRRLKALLPLLLGTSMAWAQEKPPQIMGPDGPQGLRPRKPPAARPLKDWLKERREQKAAEREERLDAGEELPPDPSDPDAAAQKPPEKPPQKATSAYFRSDLDLIYPKIFSSGASWSTEPGVRLALMGRLPAQEGEGSRLWLGFRALAFSGQGRIAQQTGRVGWIYLGPAVAWEWLHFSQDSADEPAIDPSSRQRIGLGLAGVSREGEADLGDRPQALASRGFGMDGAGLWAEYTYASQFSPQCEWEFTSGLQIGDRKLLFYLGFGLSLWQGESV